MRRRSPSLLFSALFFGTVFILPFFGSTAHAATGFVSSPLWISPASPKEGEKVTLSAVFHNEQPDTISGSIVFFDGAVILAEKEVTLRSDEVATVTTSFTISAGGHLFSASTKNISEVSTTGSIEVNAVPQATVKLPLQFVPKTIVAAQASGSDGQDSGDVILDQVDRAQTAVLNILPSATKEKVSTTVSAVDNWRSDRAENFTAARDTAKTTLDAAKTPAKTSTKTTAKKPAAQTSTGPFTYIKYVFFSALAFLFDSPLVFYLGGLLIIYLLFRFIIRI